MLLFVVLLVSGQWLVSSAAGRDASVLGVTLLMAAVLVRSGIVPLHCWMTDLFENASFGTSLFFVTPMVGAYAAIRLVLPIAPSGFCTPSHCSRSSRPYMPPAWRWCSTRRGAFTATCS